VAWLIATGMAYLVWECLQAAVRAILRLLDGNSRVEHHYHVWVPQTAAHRDPTRPGYDVRDVEPHADIEAVEIDGVWRPR
jgi:hypothetical protein